MSVTVKYKGSAIAELTENGTKILKTSGKYCEADIVVENTKDGGITPSGNINITDTNVTDVTNYATAQVVDADLVAENIKKDVNILGIVGSYEGGGGGISPVIQIPTYSAKDSGTITFASTTNSAQTITHNLGVVPDFIIIYAASGHTCKGNEMCFAYRLFKNVEIGSGTFFDTMRFKIARAGAGHGFGVVGRSIFEPELYVNKGDYYIGGSPTANTFIFYLTGSYFAPAGTTYKWEVYKL